MNDYYDPSTDVVQDQTRADAVDVNDVSAGVGAGFDLLPDKDPLTRGYPRFGTDTGTANTYVVTSTLPLTTAYQLGDEVIFLATNANTGPSTVNIDGLGAVALTFADKTTLVSGAIPINSWVQGRFDGTGFQYRVIDATAASAAAAASAVAAAASAVAAAASATAAATSATAFQANWIVAAQLGSDLNISSVDAPIITSLTGTDLAFIDEVNDDLRMYRFNYTTGIWAQVGNDLNISGVVDPFITALNSTDVAFFDSTNDDLRTYRFDGADWAQVGNDLNIPGPSSYGMTALSSTDIAFIDNINDELRTYRFDGTNWAQVGNDLNIPAAGNPALTALNSIDVAYTDGGNDVLRIYRFDGTNWAQVGNDLDISTIVAPTIAALNGTDIAFIDSNNDDLRTYRFSFYQGIGPYALTL